MMSKDSATKAESESAQQNRAELVPFQHPNLVLPEERLRYVLALMSRREWKRGKTTRELARAWGLQLTTIEDYSTKASQFLQLLGERDAILDMIRTTTIARLEQCSSDQNHVMLARLLLDCVGGVRQQHDVRVTAATASERDLAIAAGEECATNQEALGWWLEGFLRRATEAHLRGLVAQLEEAACA